MTTGGEVEEFGEGRFTSGMRVQRLLQRHKLQELPQAIQRYYSGRHSWPLRNPLYSLGVGIHVLPHLFPRMVTCHAARAWL